MFICWVGKCEPIDNLRTVRLYRKNKKRLNKNILPVKFLRKQISNAAGRLHLNFKKWMAFMTVSKTAHLSKHD